MHNGRATVMAPFLRDPQILTADTGDPGTMEERVH